jgi:MerR family transcriptional regulator, redox-sensitive transcriptional activator SoxR
MNEVPARDLSVGDLARRSGVAVSTIHFYEAKGLIHGWRSEGNQRRYPRGMLRRVAVIKAAQRTGVPLALIAKALATLPNDRAPSADDWSRLSAAWKDELDARITRLTQLRDALNDCIGCGCLSLTACPLRNPADQLAGDGAGPRLLDPL